VVGALWGLHLSGAGAIAQMVVAVVAFFALVVAWRQVWLARATARRERAFQYSERFSEERTILRIERYKRYWERTSYEAHTARSYGEQVEWRAFANWIEEVAAMYTRNLIDRDVAAETIGIYVEELWVPTYRNYIEAARDRTNRFLYVDWQWMQEDTQRRRAVYRERVRWRRERRELIGLRPFALRRASDLF
jgi:hypothetical protein